MSTYDEQVRYEADDFLFVGQNAMQVNVVAPCRLATSAPATTTTTMLATPKMLGRRIAAAPP